MYSYEAYSKIPDISLHLTEDYATGAQKLAIIVAILAFACILFTAIAHKKARPLGIITAIAQPLGIFAAFKYVIAYSSIDFSCLSMRTTSNVSMDDAMNKLSEALAERITTEVLPGLLATTPWTLLMLASFILTVIYAGNLKKDTTKGKGLAVTALILSIVKFVVFQPINSFALLLGNATAETQASWDPTYYIFTMIPLVLLAIKGILALTSRKAAPAAAEAAPVAEPVAAPVVETPVVETPVAETPVVEATAAEETAAAPAEEKAE